MFLASHPFVRHLCLVLQLCETVSGTLHSQHSVWEFNSLHMNIGVIPFCNTPIPPTTKMFEKNPLDTPTTGRLEADLAIYFYTQ